MLSLTIMNIAIKTINNAAELRALNDLAAMLKEHFNEAGLKSIEKDGHTGRRFGAYLADKLVGFIIYKEINPEAVELAWMGVSTELHGKGIGTKLVEESLREIGKSYKVCEVKTLSDTEEYEPYEKTRRFYKKLGFVPLETINPYPGWSDPCQIFVRFLAK